MDAFAVSFYDVAFVMFKHVREIHYIFFYVHINWCSYNHCVNKSKGAKYYVGSLFITQFAWPNVLWDVEDL